MAILSFLCSFLVLFGCCELVSTEENCEFVCKDGTEFAAWTGMWPSSTLASSGTSARELLVSDIYQRV